MQKLEEWILPHLHKPGVFIPSSIVLVIFTTYFVADSFGVNWYSCALFPSLVETFLVITYVVVPAKTPQRRWRNGLQLKLLARNAQKGHNFSVISVSFWG